MIEGSTLKVLLSMVSLLYIHFIEKGNIEAKLTSEIGVLNETVRELGK